MSLKDLESHIDDQNNKFKKHIENGCFSDLEPPFRDWENFRFSLWGKWLEHLRVEKSKEQGEVEVKMAAELIPEVETAAEPIPEVEMDDGSLPEVETDDEPPSNAAATRPVVKIPETTSAFWDLDSPWVLVRSEYEEAERAALSANARNDAALVVTGQPGIGTPLSPLIPIHITFQRCYRFAKTTRSSSTKGAPPVFDTPMTTSFTGVEIQ